MAKRSAGILLYRRAQNGLQVLLVHPGGPFWARKDLGAWSIPKGEHEADEEPLACALREFEEETGTALSGEPFELGSVKLKSGKVVEAWAVEGELDASAIRSNTFIFRGREYPEVDRAEWFGLEAAREKLNPAQAAFLDRLPTR
jgi:predicted NUDIX family NTP pyrophosphohydrolase